MEIPIELEGNDTRNNHNNEQVESDDDNNTDQLIKPIHFSKIIFDFVSIGIVLAVYFIIKFIVKPFQLSGFYCNDYTITLPYRSSTINSKLLLVITLFFPFCLIVATELFCSISHSISKNKRTSQNRIKVSYARLNSTYLVNFCGRIVKVNEKIGKLNF
jgi:hypothetical protein